jgi:dUTP pyrophosphatase
VVDSLKFLKIHPKAKLPTRGSMHAAGLDLHTVEDIIIQAGEYLSARTGLCVEVPPGFYGRVARVLAWL